MMQAAVSGSERWDGGDEFFQLGEHGGANFVGGRAIEREFDNAVAPFPAQSFAGEGFHAVAFRRVHRIDLGIEAFRDGVALEFADGGERPESGVKGSVQNV